MCTGEEESKERGHYEIVEKHVSLTSHKPVCTSFLRCRNQSTGKLMKQDHTKPQMEIPQIWAQRDYLYIYLYQSIYLSIISPWCSRSNIRFTVHLVPAPWLLKITLNQSAFATITSMNPLMKTSHGGYPHVNLCVCLLVHLLSWLLWVFFPWESPLWRHVS